MAKLSIPTLNIADAITTPEQRPTKSFHAWINTVVRSIQAFVNDQAQLVADIAFSIQQAGIAIITAGDAKAAAQAAAAEAALVNSYVTPATVLSSKVDPADTTKADIIIANHSRVYGDGTTVAVTGTTLTGLALASNYYITYLDASRHGGAVSYTVTTDYLQAGQGNNRHLVGNIDTPADASAPPSVGGGSRPPGTGAYSGACVTIDTLITLANAAQDGPGDEKTAGELRVGDMLWSQHNETKVWGAYPLSAIRFVNVSNVMSAQGYPDATPEHPFWVDGAWSLMLWVGSGAKTAMIARMTVADAHTFLARHPDASTAILSHNKLAEPTS